MFMSFQISALIQLTKPSLFCEDEALSINQNSPVRNSRELKQTRRRQQRERDLKM